MTWLKCRLNTMPVELLYEIHLDSISPALPYVCRRLFEVFKSAPHSYKAQYLLACLVKTRAVHASYTRCLRYPICSREVFDALLRIAGESVFQDEVPELPKRLFRSLTPKSLSVDPPGKSAERSESDPLPFLKYLWGLSRLHPPDVNSHDGYALTKAVHASSVPLIRFLLDRGASPARKNGLAVVVAIRRKQLSLVRLLIERTDQNKEAEFCKRNSKKRKLEDRLEVSPAMLQVAVKCDARDIVEYFMKEKGCVPDMRTILLM